MGSTDNVIPMRRDLSKHFQADMAKEKNVLGRKISEARKKAGITQGELSELLSHFGVMNSANKYCIIY